MDGGDICVQLFLPSTKRSLILFNKSSNIYHCTNIHRYVNFSHNKLLSVFLPSNVIFGPLKMYILYSPYIIRNCS